MENQQEIYFYETFEGKSRPEHQYLNNFAHSWFISAAGIKWWSVEHYYQAHKFRDFSKPNFKAIFDEIYSTTNADDCKKVSRKYTKSMKDEDWGKKEWDAIYKDYYMKRALTYKFSQNHDLLAKLLSTGNAKLLEESNKDKYWGGLIEGSLNKLGEMLMELRSNYRSTGTVFLKGSQLEPVKVTFAEEKTYFPVLVTDIGGTNSRMKLVKITKNKSDPPIEIDFTIYKSNDFKSLEDLIDHYLIQFKNSINFPEVAVIGIPGPIEDNKCLLIANISHWGSIEGSKIAQKCLIKQVYLINDFVICGYGVTSNLVKDVDYFVLNKGEPNESASIGIIGPGTGLGHAIGIKQEKDYEIIPSEGGHSIFICQNDREWTYRNYLANKLGLDHVSHERGLSGPPIVYMFNYFIDIEKMTPTYLDIKDSEFEVKRWKLTAEEIVIASNTTNCEVCLAVRKFFIELFANACSNLAITTVSKGGLYIVGSISNSYEKFLLNDSTFMDRFTMKGRLSGFMRTVPIYLVIDVNIGLKGSLEFARRRLNN